MTSRSSAASATLSAGGAISGSGNDHCHGRRAQSHRRRLAERTRADHRHRCRPPRWRSTWLAAATSPTRFTYQQRQPDAGSRPYRQADDHGAHETITLGTIQLAGGSLTDTSGITLGNAAAKLTGFGTVTTGTTTTTDFDGTGAVTATGGVLDFTKATNSDSVTAYHIADVGGIRPAVRQRGRNGLDPPDVTFDSVATGGLGTLDLTGRDARQLPWHGQQLRHRRQDPGAQCRPRHSGRRGHDAQRLQRVERVTRIDHARPVAHRLQLLRRHGHRHDHHRHALLRRRHAHPDRDRRAHGRKPAAGRHRPHAGGRRTRPPSR